MTAAVTFRCASGHAPPNRAPRARAAYMLRFVSTRAKFKGGDLNLSNGAVARLLRRRVVGSGVLGLSIPRRGWRVLGHQSLNVDSDHDAELVTMKHIATGEVVVFVVANMEGYSASAEHSRQVMRNVIALGADVILGSECIRFRADTVRGSGGYQWDQPGEVGSAESGVLIGVRSARAAMTDSRRTVGSKATREGDGIDERSIVRDRVTLINREKP